MEEKGKSRKQIIDSLRLAESEEGRSGLVEKFLADNPEKTKAR